MKQRGDNSNNIQIGRVSDSASVSISQSFAAFQPVPLTATSETLLSKAVLRRQARTYSLGTAGAVILSVLSALSDVFGVSQGAGVSLVWLMVPVAIAWMFLAAPHFTAWQRYRKRPREAGAANFVREDEVIKDAGDGKSWSLYRLSGACSYPHCDGEIVLTRAPARERQIRFRTYVGICSKCGEEHSYRLDANWVATPATDMAWREPDAATSKRT